MSERCCPVCVELLSSDAVLDLLPKHLAKLAEISRERDDGLMELMRDMGSNYMHRKCYTRYTNFLSVAKNATEKLLDESVGAAFNSYLDLNLYFGECVICAKPGDLTDASPNQLKKLRAASTRKRDGLLERMQGERIKLHQDCYAAYVLPSDRDDSGFSEKICVLCDQDLLDYVLEVTPGKRNILVERARDEVAARIKDAAELQVHEKCFESLVKVKLEVHQESDDELEKPKPKSKGGAVKKIPMNEKEKPRTRKNKPQEADELKVKVENLQEADETEKLKTKKEKLQEAEEPVVKNENLQKAEVLEVEIVEEKSKSKKKKLQEAAKPKSKKKKPQEADEPEVKVENLQEADDPEVKVENPQEVDENSQESNETEKPKSKKKKLQEAAKPKTKKKKPQEADEPKVKVENLQEADDPEIKIENLQEADNPEVKVENIQEAEDPEVEIVEEKPKLKKKKPSSKKKNPQEAGEDPNPKPKNKRAGGNLEDEPLAKRVRKNSLEPVLDLVGEYFKRHLGQKCEVYLAEILKDSQPSSYYLMKKLKERFGDDLLIEKSKVGILLKYSGDNLSV